MAQGDLETLPKVFFLFLAIQKPLFLSLMVVANISIEKSIHILKIYFFVKKLSFYGKVKFNKLCFSSKPYLCLLKNSFCSP